MKYLLSAFLILMVLTQTAAADDESGVRETMETKLNAALGIIEKEELDSQAKQEKMAEIVGPLFDYALMSYYALGKTNWSGLSSEDKKRFTELFTQRLKESYLTKIALYTDEKIVFETPIEEKNKIYIPTYFITQDENMSIVFKFIKRNNDWKIYDVEIEGISIISSYRSQFKETLRSGTIEELLTKLEEMESIQ